MIRLTAVSGETFVLNSDLIYRVDRSFDTIITLVDGKTVRVKDTEEKIIEKVIQYKRKIGQHFPEVEK
ncbi:flagellar FlbD family protein [Pisciglobus halotolerans]|uniref:Flagellar protein FlbD n=1 Tax=Pisciglobus halotolerans TaxID=745365 RepID=A0A1I3AN74_9LACT|nr:flagellar FlbD family protein [Pisciglobus halotolerans]SFH51412.1 flagellar protein FlbD [Pisciglobus halotolerans]